MIAINKADGDNLARAKARPPNIARRSHPHPAGRRMEPAGHHLFGRDGAGVAQLWEHVLDHYRRLSATGAFAARRREQQVKWMWALLEERLRSRLRHRPTSSRPGCRSWSCAVAEGTLSPALRGRGYRGDLGF